MHIYYRFIRDLSSLFLNILPTPSFKFSSLYPGMFLGMYSLSAFPCISCATSHYVHLHHLEDILPFLNCMLSGTYYMASCIHCHP